MKKYHIAKCENEECEKKAVCMRYISATASVVDFSKSCTKDNDYKWFYRGVVLPETK
jgi:hypothetical protein